MIFFTFVFTFLFALILGYEIKRSGMIRELTNYLKERYK